MYYIIHSVVPDLLAPRGHLFHSSAHQRHDLRDEVNHAAIVDLPEDLVKFVNVVVELCVVVCSAPRITEVVIENITASLNKIPL